MENHKEDLWRQYQIQVDLYKHHTELLLKFTAYYYAVTGAILSYYFSKPENEVLVLSLLFPIFVSFVYGWIFLYAARAVEADVVQIRGVSQTLNISGIGAVRFLPLALKTSGCLFLVTWLGLCFLLAGALWGSTAESFKFIRK